MAATTSKMKRYNMQIPETLFAELQRVADEHGVTVMDVLRQFVKLGLLVDRVTASPDASLIIRDAQGDKKVMFVF